MLHYLQLPPSTVFLRFDAENVNGGGKGGGEGGGKCPNQYLLNKQCHFLPVET